MRPSDKRLALMVEDHRLEHAHYEGIIPQGRYGAGAVVIWDSGSYVVTDGSVDGGKLVFELQGARLRGSFALVKLQGRPSSKRPVSGNEWLLMKRPDASADARWELERALTPERHNQLQEREPPCDAS